MEVSEPFFTLSVQLGAAQAFDVHTRLRQSVEVLQ
jgi:hypothetical protein